MRIESVISDGRYTLNQRGFHLLGILLAEIGQAAFAAPSCQLAALDSTAASEAF